MCIFSCYRYIIDKYNDQDFMQKATATGTFFFELFRVLMGSFLVIFVPQKCDNRICGLTENLYKNNFLFKVGFISNVVTLFAFTIIYIIEGRRETLLIKYLHVNKKKPTDSESISRVLESLPYENKEKILYLDYFYKSSTYFALLCFISNTTICGIVVFDNYLDNKTITTFITNVLFLVSKLYDTYYTTNTEVNIFYSAYLRDKIQYNDIDPHYLVRLESQRTFNIDLTEINDDPNKYYQVNVDDLNNLAKII
jgi:hypothetical protein